MSTEPRVCCKEGCGNKLGCLQKRGSACRSCQEKDVQIRRLATKAKSIDDLHAAGFVVLHSCIGPSDPFLLDCTCRKHISLNQARAMFETGEVIDYESRVSRWGGKGRDILTSSRLKRTPRAATIEKSHIQRGTSYATSRSKTLEDLERDHQALRARLAEDRALRHEEESNRWEIWNELTEELFVSITRVYSAEEWEEEEKRQRTMSCLLDGIGTDDRTAGCHDLNGSWSAVEEEENDETPTEEPESTEDTESEEISEDADVTENFDDENDDAAEFIKQSGERLAAEGD